MKEAVRHGIRNRGELPTMDVNVGTGERLVSGILGGALVAFGISRKSLLGALLAAVGGEMVFRGVSGHCPLYGALDLTTADIDGDPVETRLRKRGVKVDKCITINRTPSELYGYWRNFANLPHFMENLESVERLEGNRSRWTARGPAGRSATWEAEIVDDQPDRLIGWHSLPGAEVDSAGVVLFTPAPGGRGTEVHVVMRYAVPAGKLGATVARLLGHDPATEVQEDLRGFKQMMEAGQKPTVEGQSSGRADDDEQLAGHRRHFGFGSRDIVEQASWESFPASDAPAY